MKRYVWVIKCLLFILCMFIMLSSMLIIDFSGTKVMAKSKYNSFDEIIERYNEDKDRLVKYNRCDYNYLKLKTLNGQKKSLIITLGRGVSSETVIFIPKNEKIVKDCKMTGFIQKYSKDKIYLLTNTYSGTGIGTYSLYKYKNGKYKKVLSSDYDENNSLYPSPNTVIKYMSKKKNINIKKFKNYNYDKYNLY